MNGQNISPGGHEIAVEIGGLPIRLRSQDPEFRSLIESRYGRFLCPTTNPAVELDVDAVRSGTNICLQEELRIRHQDDVWRLEAGDFRAEWDPQTGRGRLVQSADNPYAIDSVLRIL